MDQRKDEPGKDHKLTTDEETRRREEEILNRIIPTGMMDLDKDFDEEERDNLPKSRTYDHDMDKEEDFVDYQVYHCSLPEQEKSDKFIDEDQEEEDIQSSKLLKASYQDHERQKGRNLPTTIRTRRLESARKS